MQNVIYERIANNMNMLLQLCSAKINQNYRIDHISGLNKCRFLELGFIRNATVSISKKTKNGPILVKVGNSTLAIRHDDAKNIYVIDEGEK